MKVFPSLRVAHAGASGRLLGRIVSHSRRIAAAPSALELAGLRPSCAVVAERGYLLQARLISHASLRGVSKQNRCMTRSPDCSSPCRQGALEVDDESRNRAP